VLVQWIHTYEMSDELVKLVLRTLRARFPHVTGWQGGDGDLLLLASRTALEPDDDELARRTEIPTVKADLARIDVEGVAGVLALQVMTEAQVAAYAGEGPTNRDDHNRLEYRAPVAFFADEAAHVPDARRTPNAFQELLIAPYLATHPLDAERAAQIARAIASGQNADFAPRRAAAEAWVALEPGSEPARRMLAAIALEQGEPQVARAALEGLPASVSESLREAVEALDAVQRASPWTPRVDATH
jgi:hypothetical protein